ncbi:MAG: flavin reductase family protein [Anaerolineae bacterium]|nr:flavin reductase family protein [Anaerolineae bacterium]
MREVTASEAIAAQRPEWIVLVVTRREDGFVDVMPAGWVMRVSGTPPMFAVSVGHSRYTNELVRQAGEFVLAFPSAHMAETVAICGSHSGREMDKVERCGLKMVPGRVLSTPLIEDAFINFECRLTTATEAGDHTIFVGEVLASYMGDVPGPLVNFGGNRYALARPAG